MRLTSFRRTAVLALTGAVLAGTSGCFGSFNLTRKLYTFNKTVSKDKFIQELAFLGMTIVPVYQLVGAVDVLFANTVEFWTGKNPIDMASTIKLDDKTKVER